MKRLIYYEFKKICNKTARLAIGALILYSLLMVGIQYFYYPHSTMTSNGEIVTGVKAYHALKEAMNSLETQFNQENLEPLIEQFNQSSEKKNLELGKEADRMKYQYLIQYINFAAHGLNVMDYSYDLDYDFLSSEDAFYDQYKQSVIQLIRENNFYGGYQYSEDLMQQVYDKVEASQPQLDIGYREGLTNMIGSYGQQLYLVFVVLALTLSTLLSKDSVQGIDELGLSSAFGRKRNMNARIMAGNLFAVMVYVVFILTLIIEHGVLASLEGWHLSAQSFWYTCLYDISFGTGILMMFAQGLLGVLVVSNLVMMLSIRFKYSKLSVLLALLSVGGLVELTKTANPLQLQLNPLYFGTRLAGPSTFDFEIYYFIGEAMVPYSLVIVLLTLGYLVIIRLLTRSCYKRYYLN